MTARLRAPGELPPVKPPTMPRLPCANEPPRRKPKPKPPAEEPEK